jgi:hypothetical protein
MLFQANEFPGLIPLINSYLSGMDVDADTHCTIQQYLKLIQRRASGDLQTTASWIRQFVQSHPEYRLAPYLCSYKPHIFPDLHLLKLGCSLSKYFINDKVIGLYHGCIMVLNIVKQSRILLIVKF